MERLRIRLLGGFEAVVDGRPVPGDAWRPRRGADLVKLLALSPGRRLHRERAVEALWPRLGARAGLANLHKAAHLARRALGDKDAVVLRGGQVLLAPAAVVETDVEAFEAAGDPDLYGGDLLPDDRYEEWTHGPRERLRSLLLERLREAGRLEELVAAEPGDEAARCALAEALAARGRRDAALRHLHQLRDALAALGLRPGPEATALLERLTRGEAAVAPVSAQRPLVGRDREISAVRALLEGRVGRGRGTTVLVTGEPGIGKTRLCEELLVLAAGRGMSTLRGTAHEAERSAPYAPVVDALDRLLAARPDLAAGLTAAARGELRRLSVAAPGGDAAPPSGAPDRQRIFAAVGQLVAAAARERGAAIVLDDLHAADAATVDLAAYLARAAAFQPLLVVLAFRDGEAGPALARARAALLDARAATELRLEALAREAAGALVADVSGGAAGDTVAAAIWGLAEGNPFFTEELAGAVASDGTLAVPGRLYEVLNGRLARLATPVRGSLELLALAADEFTADDVRALCGLDGDEALEVLDAGLRSGLLRESGAGCRFRHALVRDALLRGSPAHRRAAAHRTVAERLAAAGAPAARVAEHLVAGGRAEAAVGWLARAARDAAGVAAYSDALGFATAALERARGAERADLLALRADLLVATGDPAAPAAYAAAIAAAGGGAPVGLRARQARALLLAGDVPAAEAALDGVTAAGGADAARLAVARALATWFRGDLEGARRAADAARRLAVAEGLGDELIEATALRAAVAHTAGDWPGRVRHELTETLARPELAHTVFDALHCTAEYVLAGGGPYEPLDAATGELRAAAARSGAARAEAFAATVAGEARLLAADLDGAGERLREAVELNGRVGTVCGQALAHARLAQALAAAGADGEVPALLDAALGYARWSPLANHLLHLVYEAMLRTAPDAERAVALLDEAAGSLERHRACPFCGAGFQAAAAIACADAGDPARARGYAQAAEGAALLWSGGPQAAAAAEAHAAVALAEGAAGEGAALLRTAADGFAAAGQRLHEARARTRLEALA